ncbi:MAG: hypothetical protein LC649_09975 [Bacteroidales bacterium]|nr:hypothetical protein [Bacteroidales bacterium]
MDRNEFRTNAKKKIDEIFQQIDELENKRDKAGNDIKSSYNEMLGNLKKEGTELQKRYDSLQNASDDKWEEAKKAFSESTESFKEGFNRIFSLFKKR